MICFEALSRLAHLAATVPQSQALGAVRREQMLAIRRGLPAAEGQSETAAVAAAVAAAEVAGW